MPKCCRAKVCFTCSNEQPTDKDACMCGCGYLNGGFQVAVSQCLLLIGILFSLVALGDCAFAKLDEQINEEPENPIENPSPELYDVTLPPFQRVGYITFEKTDGRCYFYDAPPTFSNAGDQIQKYFDIMGSDWQFGRIFATITVVIGTFVFLYSISFCCSSQVKAVRLFIGFLLSIVLTVFQGLTFVVFGSNFCDENGCGFERSAGLSIGAMVCYFMAGICFCTMSDYPGEEAAARVGEEKAEADEEAGVVTAKNVAENEDDEEVEGDKEVAGTGENEEQKAEQAPEDTPAEQETTTEGTLAEDIPAEETPAEETPAEETPEEKNPEDETPAEETPEEETPAEEVTGDEKAAPEKEEK